MKIDVTFSGNSAAMPADMSTQPKTIPTQFGALTVLHDGQNGATFFPTVSDDGVLSWTNDRQLDNPQPVNIKGRDGADGYTPVKGKDYFDGKDGRNGVDGKDGKDGKDGYTPVKGVDYFDGKNGTNGRDGANGKDGYTPVKGIDYFDGKDGESGKDGSNGKDGADGRTPEKGVDYFTADDKAELVASVIAALPVYNGEVQSV